MSFIPTILWTALPRAIVGDEVRFTVYVSFRLDEPGIERLGDYAVQSPMIWPERMIRMAEQGELLVQLQSGGSLVRAQVDTTPIRADVWNALFQDSSLVRKHEFKDNTQRPIRSFNVMALENYLDSLYAHYANGDPDEFPDVRQPGMLADLVSSVGRAREDMPKLMEANAYRIGPHPDQEAEQEIQNYSVGGVPVKDFYNAFRFYRRKHAWEYPTQTAEDGGEVPDPVKLPTFDVHQVIAALGDHPTVLRMLGLALDCRISLEEQGLVMPSNGELRVFPNWTDAARDESMRTVYVADPKSGLFRAKPRRPDEMLDEGLLDLSNPKRFGIVQTDVDGNALKTLEYASGIHNRNHSPVHPQGKPLQESLPAQRNGGLSVVRIGRDEQLNDDLWEQANINAALSGVPLFAEDLNRGFRVDVKTNGRWHSLCERQATYLLGINGSQLAPIMVADEGYVKAASASSSGEGAQADMYLHESLFGWENWSLVAERPGKTISFDQKQRKMQPMKIEKEESTPPDEFPFTPRIRPTPGTLPRLRYGGEYQLRARTVDLAGGGISAAEADEWAVGGESLPRTYLRYEPINPPALVMRGPIGLAESVEHLVIRTRIGAPIQNLDETKYFNTTCSRFVAPPKSSQITAELHGALDDIWSNPQQAYNVAKREAGTFNDPAKAVIFEGDHLYNGDGKFPNDYERGDPLPTSAEGLHIYVAHTGSTLDLPYLPDPMATGFVLNGVPTKDVADTQWLFAGVQSWPDYVPFALTLKTGASISAGVNGSDLLINVPAGEMISMRYSSATDDRVEGVMAHFEKMTGAQKSAVASRGYQHWMLTPYRNITFVHATEQPVLPAHIYKWTAYRNVGDTFVALQGVFNVEHTPSTMQVDVEASWTDWEDDVRKPKWAQVPRTGHVSEHKIEYGQSSTVNVPQPSEAGIPRQEFGDTKHRVVTYKLVGTTRYREYFPPELYEQRELITRDDGDTKTLSIPSSARPAPPKLLYVVPTYRWQDTSQGRKRHGGGLRIYLDRPWYSSGEGELLAVVLRPSGSVPEWVKDLTSDWGADPVFEGPVASPRLTESDFRTTSDITPITSPDRQLAERGEDGAPPQEVPIVAFEPQYDEDRQLWYVDVEIDPQAMNTPFVRLALARYQPESLSGLHLSSVVRAQFNQLQHDRTATFTFSRNQLNVSVAGYANQNLAARNAWAAPDPEIPNIGKTRGGLVRGEVGAPENTIDKGLIGRGEPLARPKPNPEAGRGRLVTAQFERHANPAAGDLGWVSIGDEQVLPSHTFSGGEANYLLWKNSLSLPASYGLGEAHRVVVREYEVHQTVDGLGEPVPSGTVFVSNARRRLVYADAYEI